VLSNQQRLDVQAERDLDRFTGGAGRRDDDDSAPRMLGAPVGVDVGRKCVVAGWMHRE
jgi:hypothetical protein